MTDTVFVDTSGLYAVLDANDVSHSAAATGWQELTGRILNRECTAVTHYGVIVEASALVQRRLGMSALHALHEDMLKIIEIIWISSELHRRAVAAALASRRRGISLVDWTSFQLMRERSIRLAFAFDEDFKQQGFAILT